MKQRTDNAICIGPRCQYYEILNIGAGCWQTTPPNSLWNIEWIRLDRLKRCPGVKIKEAVKCG